MSETLEDEETSEVAVSPVVPEARVRHAAILWRGGNDTVLDRKIAEPFDFWHYTTDTQVMLKVDESRLVMADSLDELVMRLEARYPTLPGCTLIDEHHGPLRRITQREPNEGKYSYRRRHRERNSQWHKYRGWVVLNVPHRHEIVDRDHLRDLLVQHRVLLLSPDQVKDLGGPDRLMEHHFSPVAGCHGHTKVRWNPKAVALRKWRQGVRETEAKCIQAFPEHVMVKLGNAVNPTNWPSDMPFSNLISGIRGRERAGGWHNHYHSDPSYDASTILDYVELARKLKKGSTPWRESRQGLGHTITDAAPYVRYIIKHGKYDTDKKLARWLLKEAKVAGIEVPPIAVLPPKPFARRKKHQAQGRAVHPAPTDPQDAPASGPAVECPTPTPAPAEQGLVAA